MPQIDSHGCFDAESSSRATKKRRAPTRSEEAATPSKSLEIQAFPHWAKAGGGAAHDAPNTHYCAGAALAFLDHILHSGADVSSAGKSSAEPPFAGALRQRLALRAAATCAAMARLREDEAALRDAEHLAGFDAAPTPGGRLHRLWRLFATRPARLDAPLMRAAAECLDLPPDIDGSALAALVGEASTVENPLNAATRVSTAALHILDDAPQIDAEMFALWLADLVLAQRLRWEAPLPLLATTIAHPSMRTATGRRPRPSDPDWSSSVACAAARAAQEAYALAAELSRRSNILLSVAPKLRAKKALRVVELLLADDCVSPARAAKAAGLSDRAARRLFDRLVALGAVRELSGRANFRLYGL
ncbi:DUF1403 family protein [Methylocystis sp. FS]|uniref:DUF1403 family protein n=1 Tax=Methylocystis silviterrae TaxID=2743612 RepID=UPI001581CA5F|nr:DUF1403 family protein [Methylocystis silviterrae]NUJ81418.1 DUF1403 family protein [Methylocystis silviterrae]